MKFSAILIATLATSTSAFAPSRPSINGAALSAATLEAPSAEAAVETPAPAETTMAVEKDWAVNEFVKDSERVQP